MLNLQKKIKKKWEICLLPKTLQGENMLQNMLSTIKNKWFGTIWKIAKTWKICEKEEAISAIRNTVILDAENLGLVRILEAKSGKGSTMDQELDVCKRLYEKATCNMRRVCVTLKKYNVNKPPYFQIRLFTAKDIETL